MCGDIQLSSDEFIICGRTMEFCEPLASKLIISPRGSLFKTSIGMEWYSTFGFVGISVLDMNSVIEGMNELGFSCGILTLEATKYTGIIGIDIPEKDTSIMSILDVCDWLLGQCFTVEDAIYLLKSVTIWGESIPIINRLIGLHIVLHDSLGRNGVCEIINGELQIYSNELGIATNGPPFPHQLNNLQQYQRGTVHIRDGWSSATRFVKLAEMKRLCKSENNTPLGLVHLVCHMFNNVDIPCGVSISKRDHEEICETTQWVVIKNLTERIIYYRVYNDMCLRRITFSDLDFSGATHYKSISIDVSEPICVDMTNMLTY